MAEGGVGTCPQVFVVDSHAKYVSASSGRKPRWDRASRKFVLLLMVLVMSGLVVEGYLIYNLNKKTEVLSLSLSHHLCQNQSNPTLSQQGGNTLSLLSPKESSEVAPVQPLEQIKQRPFAQLIGSRSPSGESEVVQWVHKGGETITNNMGYNNGRLLVQMDGHYYIYSKLTLNVAKECSPLQHRVMKDTKAYDRPIELMKSKSFRCGTSKPSGAKSSGTEVLWNSFLAGIFHLQSEDEIFVTLDDMQSIRPGTTDNFMGAFMISP